MKTFVLFVAMTVGCGPEPTEEHITMEVPPCGSNRYANTPMDDMWQTAADAYAVMEMGEMDGVLGSHPPERLELELDASGPTRGVPGCVLGEGTITFDDGSAVRASVMFMQIPDHEPYRMMVSSALSEEARRRYGLDLTVPAGLKVSLWPHYVSPEEGIDEATLVGQAALSEWKQDGDHGEWLHSSCESVGDAQCLSFPEAPAGAPVPW